MIASKAGLENLQERHSDVTIHVASIDDDLDETGFIVPGLGDAGDRQFITEGHVDKPSSPTTKKRKA
jgi:uracil phosphoribosyltransferase